MYKRITGMNDVLPIEQKNFKIIYGKHLKQKPQKFWQALVTNK